MLVGTQCIKYPWALFAAEWNKILESFRLIGLYHRVHCYHNNSERCIFQNTALIHLVQALRKDYFIGWLLLSALSVRDYNDISELVLVLEIFPKLFLDFCGGCRFLPCFCSVGYKNHPWQGRGNAASIVFMHVWQSFSTDLWNTSSLTLRNLLIKIFTD